MSTDENAFKRVTWNDEHDPSDDDGPDGMPLRMHGESLSPEDRELLTLAAGAIGARFEEVEGEGHGNLHFEDGTITYAWNPLRFQGDSFDLGVALGLFVNNIDFIAKWAEETRTTSDRVAATRRAVTRAAAEIHRKNS